MDPTNPTLCVIGIFVERNGVITQKALWRYGCPQKASWRNEGPIANPPPHQKSIHIKSIDQSPHIKRLMLAHISFK